VRRLVPIGRFSQITRLTPKALRIYDEMGLLPPARVDPDSGYRYYGLDQIGLAARIRTLRSVEMPLEEIGQVVNEPDPERVRELMERHRQRVEDRIAAYRRAATLLDRVVRVGEIPTYEVRVKHVPTQRILYIRAAASLSEMDTTMPAALRELYSYLERVGLHAAGPAFCAYPYPEASAGDFAADACVPLDTPVQGEGRIQALELPAGPIAWTVHVGPYEELPLAFEAVLSWIYERGHDITGPLREMYRVGPGSGQAPDGYVTEVAWPIR
jgi:DNA-binding transcriptional MerR regulator